MFVVWWEKETRKRKNSRRRTKNLGIKNEEYGFVFFVLSSSSRATDISIRSSIRSNSETKTNREE
jgi:hypothetical protein